MRLAQRARCLKPDGHIIFAGRPVAVLFFSARLEGLRGFLRITNGVENCLRLDIIGVDGQVGGCTGYGEGPESS